MSKDKEGMNETILVVDDEAKIRATLRGVLSDEGFRVLDADGSTRVLDLVATQRPHLVILDIWMPQIDGIELLEQLKASAPALPVSGIVFSSLSAEVTIPATVEYVDSTAYSTSLCREGVVAKTVEHLMSALHGYGITNLMVKMQGEIPVLDGSAVAFCQLLESAGIAEQDETVEELRVDRTYSIEEVGADKLLCIEPADHLEVHYTLIYPEPIGQQEYHYIHRDAAGYRDEIAL